MRILQRVNTDITQSRPVHLLHGRGPGFGGTEAFVIHGVWAGEYSAHVDAAAAEFNKDLKAHDFSFSLRCFVLLFCSS